MLSSTAVSCRWSTALLRPLTPSPNLFGKNSRIVCLKSSSRQGAGAVPKPNNFTPDLSQRWHKSTLLQCTSQDVQTDDEVDSNILPFCDINKQKKKSLGELEQEFLLALQSFYLDGAPIMSNEDFDNLKEELLWQGSSVAILSPDEQRFMEASLAYAAGKPFLSDDAYDSLKKRLKQQGSRVAIEGPRCSLRSKRVYSDSKVDYLRMLALNIPAALAALAIVFLFDDVTGFEITYLLELPEPYSFLVTWFFVLPTTFLIAQSLTNFVFKDFLILNGPCPNCGSNNVSFFGTILTVRNEARTNKVKCESCGSILVYDLDERRINLEDNTPVTP